jgi:hypothetical protein
MAKAKRIPKIKFNNLGNEQKKLMMNYWEWEIKPETSWWNI